MKMYVVTDAQGDVVATLHDSGSGKDVALVAPLPLAGQKAHHIDLPKEFEGLKNPEDLHKKLKAHLKG